MAEWRASSPALGAARAAARSEIAKARTAYIETRVTELRQRSPKAAAARLKSVVTRAVEHLCLGGEFTLRRPDGTAVTVAEILSDTDKWHGARFADPLEPDYRDDKRIAYASLRPDGGEPFVYSHAHGGVRYALDRESAEIRLVRGKQPRAVDEAIVLLRGRGEVFERRRARSHRERRCRARV